MTVIKLLPGDMADRNIVFLLKLLIIQKAGKIPFFRIYDDYFMDRVCLLFQQDYQLKEFLAGFIRRNNDIHGRFGIIHSVVRSLICLKN